MLEFNPNFAIVTLLCRTYTVICGSRIYKISWATKVTLIAGNFVLVFLPFEINMKPKSRLYISNSITCFGFLLKLK